MHDPTQERHDVYVRLSDAPVSYNSSYGSDVHIDYDANGQPVGVEVLGACTRGVTIDGLWAEPVQGSTPSDSKSDERARDAARVDGVYQSEWATAMRAMLGRTVRVTLGHQSDGTPVTQDGILLEADDEGQVVLRDETGCMHYCWPSLDCQPLGDGTPSQLQFAPSLGGAWVVDETRTGWGIKLSDEDDMQEYGTAASSKKAAQKDIARVPIWSEGTRSAVLMKQTVQHRETAWTIAEETP